MSANNQVIIRKVAKDKFEGYDVDVDAYYDPENYEYYHGGKPPSFSATTLEEAIKAYNKYCSLLAEAGLYVEYGLEFEGI
jgi:hypothetical protein